MTSEPRRLQLSDPDPHDHAAPVIEHLSSRYTVERGPVRTVRRTALETFDRRLAGAGLSLELRRGGGRQELVLTRGDGTTLRSAAEGFEPPALAADLPPGAVRDAVTGAMKLRAVIAQDEQRRRVQTLTVRDRRDKTVVRIELDAPVGAGPASVAIAPLRGYDSDGDAVTRLLARLPGSGPVPPVEPAPTAFDEPPDVQRSTPAPQAVADVVEGYLAVMRANLPGLVDDIDTEFLHDFRVAVRRTRSTLKLSRAVLDPATGRRREADGKHLGDLTTPLRDLDVHLLGLPAMRRWLVSADPDDLGPFEAHLRRRRAAAHRALVRALGTRRSQAFLANWTGELVETAGEGLAVSAEKLSRRSISRAHRRVVKLGSAIDADAPAGDLHTLRKRCKELRYALEMFTSLHDAGTTGKAISDLKRLQDCLGRFQDAEVQQGAVRTFAEEMSSSRSAPAATLLAMGELVTHLETDQAAARAEFADAFARFTRTASTARLKALGTGGAR